MTRQRRPALVALLFLLTALWTPAPESAEGVLRGIRPGEQRAGARLVVDLDAPVPYFLRQEGSRVHLLLQDGLRAPLEGVLAFPARSFRAQGTAGQTEVVVELATAAVTAKAFPLQNPDRVVVDLLPQGGAPRTSATSWSLPPLPTLPPVPLLGGLGTTAASPLPPEFLSASGTGTTAPAPGALRGNTSRRERGQSLFSGDVVLRRRFASQPFVFFVPAGDGVLPGARAELRWRASSLLDGSRSSLTVTLDGVPLASQKMDKNPEEGGLWSVPLPFDRLAPGRHVLDVAAFLATSSDACTDLENPALWCRLESPGRVRWSFVPRLPSHPRQVPFFFRTARQGSPDLLPALVVPDEASFDEVALGIGLVLDLLREPRATFPVRIRRLGEAEEPSDPPRPQAFVGLWPRWPATLLRQLGAPSSPKGPFAGLAPVPAGSWSFLAGAASLPELRRSLEALGCFPPEEEAPFSPAFRSDGTLFFRDLVGSDLVFRGLGPQEDAVSVVFPPEWDLESGGEVLLRFRHAPGLDPRRSALTVERNGVPLGGVRLTEENALGGSLRVPLDLSALRGRPFSLGLRAHLDTGTADCSGRNGETAWLVVERTSWVRLPHRTTSPDLAFENLPGAWGTGPLTIVLPPRAPGPLLTLVARLLQLWQSRGKLPEVRWLSLEHASSLLPGPVLALGDREALARQGLMPYLSEDARGSSGPSALSADCLLRLDLGKTSGGSLLAVSWRGSFPREAVTLPPWDEALRGFRAAVLPDGAVLTVASASSRRSAPPESSGFLTVWEERLKGDRFLVGVFSFAGAVVAGALIFLILRLRRTM